MGNTIRGTPRVVLDTNVVVAGLRSRRGASYQVLAAVGRGKFEIALSVPLVLEYEDALLRHLEASKLKRADVDAIVDYLCQVAHQQRIFYLWRPFLPDAKDDLVLELAVAANCQSIVTFNVRDFKGSEQFGIAVKPPVELLKSIGAIR